MFPTRHDLIRILVLIVFGLVWWAAYSALNAWNAQPERAVHLKPRPSDYWPWLIQPATAVIYIVLAAALIVWPCVLSWQGKAFWNYLAMVSVGTIIGFSIFALWPLNISRPEFTGERFGESMMRKVFAIDQSANCFPSFHTFFAVLGAIVVAHQSGSSMATVIAVIMAFGVIISTITTGQHYLIDVAGGGFMAVLSYVVVRLCEMRCLCAQRLEEL